MFPSGWKTFSHILRFFHMFTIRPLTVFSPCAPTPQECSFSGWQVKAGGSEERPNGRNQTQTAELEKLLFFFSSLLLTLCRLISAIVCVSLCLSLHAMFQCCTLVCLSGEKKNKKETLLSFLCFGFFFFSVGFCFHDASHLPWSHSLTLPQFNPLYPSSPM